MSTTDPPIDSPTTTTTAPPPSTPTEPEPFTGEPIPDLPPSPQFATLDELLAFLHKWGTAQGVGFVKGSSSSKREINGQRQPAYYQIDCDRGHRRPSQSTGLRRPTTRRINCPFRIRASCRKAKGNTWTYSVIPGRGHHNHGASIDPVAHPVLRRRTPEQKALIRSLCSIQRLQVRDILEIMRVHDPEIIITARDVSNERLHMKLHPPPAAATTAATTTTTTTTTGAAAAAAADTRESSHHRREAGKGSGAVPSIRVPRTEEELKASREACGKRLSRGPGAKATTSTAASKARLDGGEPSAEVP
ncbi:hypothetical protein E4U56_006332 [Claviceps arundinis]|uniref:FAR1 domain-containing protein n=1 Tax=Claviceps arundinis TaxID=1623583 RepID=A0A9P7MXS4_9HYPO|nr:hypothetical protein E4U56_006332 [Claviceps arundinis]